MRYTQNVEQAGHKRYTYTLYDALKRPIESGEMVYPGSFTQAQIDNLEELPTGITKREHTLTVYSTPHPSIGYYGANASTTAQRNLRNRVSYTESTCRMKVSSTVYSYDIHGNAEWLCKDILGLGKNYMLMPMIYLREM